jgi:hypothetical protein
MLDERAWTKVLLEASDKIQVAEAVEDDLNKGPHAVIRHLLAHARKQSIRAARELLAADPAAVEECRRLRGEVLRFKRGMFNNFLSGEETNDA